MNPAISGLTPSSLWRYFEELSAIPRCSKHEDQAARYVLGTAKRLGCEAFLDKAKNVIARKPAWAGRESAPMVALQCHLDMVCEKNSDKVHDFSRDPIELVRDGDFIRANGTTLGADNGIGVATSLALMEERTVNHGPLEFLFTVDEETGLNGAVNLEPGVLQSRMLLNLDSEDEGVVYVGCSGGVDTTGDLPITFESLPVKHRLMRLIVRGLRGGHSGLEIHTGRGNAIKLVARALRALDPFRTRLCSVQGGNKRNAIPREAEALVALPASAAEKAVVVIGELCAIVVTELAAVDPAVCVSLEPAAKKTGKVMTRRSQKKLVNLLHALPHGVLAMSRDIPGLVETSTNLAMIRTGSRGVVIETSQRSSVASEKRDAMNTVASAFALAGATVKHGSGYPGWKPDLSSPLLGIAKTAYERLFGKPLEVKAVHAGLECGIIGEKYPGLDMLSLGPTLQMVHSPGERVEIASVEKYWKFLKGILEAV
ncbi:MAG: aminoacyl-histidine dipeptidase [Chitinispirillaceae bacterium]|nr:aminoacyl-histidine dipeptidase [Chitinispirillaceae bacterium]